MKKKARKILGFSIIIIPIDLFMSVMASREIPFYEALYYSSIVCVGVTILVVCVLYGVDLLN